MTNAFPRTTVGGVSLPRMLMGTNWILGFSHKTAAADKSILEKHSTVEGISEILCAYLDWGVDAIMLPHRESDSVLINAIKHAEDKTGKPIIRIFTPGINTDDTPEGRKEAEDIIKDCKKLGATFCMPHHGSVEQLINKGKQTIERLPDYLSMIRDNDMIPGLSAHMPEVVVYSDMNEYDAETYIQIYNCMGFLMQVEVELIHNIIWNAKKPVMTIKPLAAGRVTPFVGITFAFNTIREQDMVTVGATTKDEVYEDVEIALAAIERRRPDFKGRSSPNKTSIMK